MLQNNPSFLADFYAALDGVDHGIKMPAAKIQLSFYVDHQIISQLKQLGQRWQRGRPVAIFLNGPDCLINNVGLIPI